MKNKECKAGEIFRHKNGKVYIVVAEDGCFYGDSGPIYGKFGARSLRNGKPFGPMRDMLIANVVAWGVKI